MYIHIYSIISIWILGNMIEGRNISDEDIENLIELLISNYRDIIDNRYIYLDELVLDCDCIPGIPGTP